jgi:hypothetical protein
MRCINAVKSVVGVAKSCLSQVEDMSRFTSAHEKSRRTRALHAASGLDPKSFAPHIVKETGARVRHTGMTRTPLLYSLNSSGKMEDRRWAFRG